MIARRTILGIALGCAPMAACAELASIDPWAGPAEAATGGVGSGADGGQGQAGASSSASGMDGGGGGGTAGAGTAVSSSGGAGGTGGQPPSPQVPCDATLCIDGAVCCVPPMLSGRIVCAAPGTCDVGALEIACDGPEDCPSQHVCCGTWSDSTWTSIACQPTCRDSSEWVMCGADGASNPAACQGTTCIQDSVFPNYWVCQ